MSPASLEAVCQIHISQSALFLHTSEEDSCSGARSASQAKSSVQLSFLPQGMTAGHWELPSIMTVITGDHWRASLEQLEGESLK